MVNVRDYGGFFLIASCSSPVSEGTKSAKSAVQDYLDRVSPMGNALTPEESAHLRNLMIQEGMISCSPRTLDEWVATRLPEEVAILRDLLAREDRLDFFSPDTVMELERVLSEQPPAKE